MFLPLLLSHSLTRVICYGRAGEVYIRLNLMKFSGRTFYDFLHCYQKKNWYDTMTSSNGNIFRVTGLCAGNSPVPGEFPTQRPVTQSFNVTFDLHPNKALSKQSWAWWFETLSCSLWRHCNARIWQKPYQDCWSTYCWFPFVKNQWLLLQWNLSWWMETCQSDSCS